jgi:hypothetical protein
MGDLRERKAEVGVGVGARVDDPDDQLVLAVERQRGGDRQLERQVAPLMIAHVHAVEPHGGEVVHRPEAQQVQDVLPTRPVRLRPMEAEAIPGHAGVVPQIGRLGLPGPRHPDRPQLGT